MEIEEFSWVRVRIPLVRPFKLAPSTASDYNGVIVKICSGEVCGYGEASPSLRVTHESVDTVESALESVKEGLIGQDPRALGKLLSHLDSVSGPSAIASVDFALHDLLGKILGISVHSFLGA